MGFFGGKKAKVEAATSSAAEDAEKQLAKEIKAEKEYYEKYGNVEEGTFPSLEYRMFFTKGGEKISPWHDIPTWADKEKGIVNAVIEIPKKTRAKMEVATKEETNPILQDTKKGKLRDYAIDIEWNYGMIPRTWEDPNIEHPEVKAMGDDDPLDVVEVGQASVPRGSVIQAKALGVLAMIDDGELDWKVIALNVNDPKAAEINTLEDLEAAYPGTVHAVREWFRTYKTHVGKPLNKFGLDEKCMDEVYTKQVIEETHHHWEQLKAGKSEKGEIWVN